MNGSRKRVDVHFINIIHSFIFYFIIKGHAYHGAESRLDSSLTVHV